MITLHIRHNRKFVGFFFSVIFDFSVEIVCNPMSDGVHPSRSHIEVRFDLIEHVDITAVISRTDLLVRKVLFEERQNQSICKFLFLQ